MRVVAIVTGISGVGKSRLLKDVMRQMPGQLLVASDIIADEMALQGIGSVSHDKLRELNIEKNQDLLTSGFSRKADLLADLIVLDSHVVIDTPRGLIPISPDVFSKIGANRIIFIEDLPERIFLHRAKDNSRVRPFRNIEALREQQAVAKSQAHNLARTLRADFFCINSEDNGALQHALRPVRGST